jgi:hypothetical protein
VRRFLGFNVDNQIVTVSFPPEGEERCGLVLRFGGQQRHQFIDDAILMGVAGGNWLIIVSELRRLQSSAFDEFPPLGDGFQGDARVGILAQFE